MWRPRARRLCLRCRCRPDPKTGRYARLVPRTCGRSPIRNRRSTDFFTATAPHCMRVPRDWHGPHSGDDDVVQAADRSRCARCDLTGVFGLGSQKRPATVSRSGAADPRFQAARGIVGASVPSWGSMTPDTRRCPSTHPGCAPRRGRPRPPGAGPHAPARCRNGAPRHAPHGSCARHG
jgi:hypothetical protein